MLDLIAAAKADGLTTERACGVLGLSPRTVQRWQAPVQPRPVLLATEGIAAAPAVMRPRPYNALTASEAAAVIALIQSPKHADASCRELALALQTAPSPIYVSHVTIWQYECMLNCNGPRGRQVYQRRGRTAPDTDWVNGPNQLWDWDITCLHTWEPRVFLYLYSLLDHWSRKNIRLAHQSSGGQRRGADLVGSRLDQRRLAGPTCSYLAQVAQRPGYPDALALDDHLLPQARHPTTVQPTTHAQRQPIHRVALRHRQNPARLPWLLCRPDRSRRLFPPILPLVQRCASPHPPRYAYAHSGPLGTRPTTAG